MPRLLDPVADLAEIERILNSSHLLSIWKGKKIVNNVKDATIVFHESADGRIGGYSLFTVPNFKRKKEFREGGGVYFFICEHLTN